MSTMRTGSSPLAGVAAGTVLLVTAACGSAGGPTTTDTPAIQLANSVCSSLTASIVSLEGLKSGALTSQLLRPQLGRAERQLESTREALARSPKQLDTTDAGQVAANKSLDLVARRLQADVHQIYKTLNIAGGGAALTVSVLPAVRAELGTMTDDLKVVSRELDSFAPSHRLKGAFQRASVCQQIIH